LFSFTLGVAMYRLSPWLPRRESALAILPPLALIAIAFCTVGAASRLVWEFGVVFAAFPALLAAGVAFEAPVALRGAFRVAGDVSYAIYSLHWPLIKAFALFAKHFALGDDVAAALFLALIGAAAAAAVRFYDKPARAWLRARTVWVSRLTASRREPRAWRGCADAAR
jgi:peptidoglycan/LPS O-acetylase OafA/YrhL